MNDDAGNVMIRKNDEDVLSISNDSQGRGKMIVYMTGTEEKTADAFQVAISWKSLDKLRERMKRQVLDWEVADKSFGINSQNGIIQLRFVALDSGLTAYIVLSKNEADAFNLALFEKQEQKPC